jgi:amino acid transporter
MSFDQEDYDRAVAGVQDGRGLEEFAPTSAQKLGRFTLVSLPLNRTIGSGIFVTPALILKGTGSVGASLLLWTAGAVIATSALLVWLELGLSVPRQRVRDGSKKSVPRSGGEKNYVRVLIACGFTQITYVLQLEYVFPHILTTCMYGVVFIILGNLSGNAIAFGLYVMSAAGYDDPSRGSVIGVAIGALTLVCLVHMASRRGGIALNNFFAVSKVAILLIIIILGFIRSRGYTFGGHAATDDYPTHNFDLNSSFKGDGQNAPSFADALLFIVYTYSGFEQPFYVSFGTSHDLSGPR